MRRSSRRYSVEQGSASLHSADFPERVRQAARHVFGVQQHGIGDDGKARGVVLNLVAAREHIADAGRHQRGKRSSLEFIHCVLWCAP